MELVIPQLVKSLHKRKEDLILGTSELLFSFVAAFEHIPSQRQLDLFKSLVNKLGPTDFLFALLILLLDKYPDDQVVIGFAANLAGSYDALTQLRVSLILCGSLSLYGSNICADSREIPSSEPRHT